jgi:hypothetical protein
MSRHSFAIPRSLDAIEPENYFGLGFCSWVIDTLSVSFFNEKAKFVSGIGIDGVVTSKAVSHHFLKSVLSIISPPSDDIFAKDEEHYLAKMGPQFRTILKANAFYGRKMKP